MPTKQMVQFEISDNPIEFKGMWNETSMCF